MKKKAYLLVTGDVIIDHLGEIEIRRVKIMVLPNSKKKVIVFTKKVDQWNLILTNKLMLLPNSL